MEVFPTEYIPFTLEQRERAAATDLEEFLRRRGEKLLSAGRDKRLVNDHSVTIRGSQWFDHGTETGGRAISFVMRYYALDYPQAVSLLLDAGVSPAQDVKPSEAVLTLPEASGNMHRLFAYLCSTRGLSPAAVAAFVRAGLLYPASLNSGGSYSPAPMYAICRFWGWGRWYWCWCCSPQRRATSSSAASRARP